MDTKTLERFATQARRELIAAVEAQATAVLTAGSVARIERLGVVERLEAEIAAHGQKHVIDKVAYTWFNRLIALRYMDARGYTSAGVVSPARGHAHGQPEILADAKRGHIDDEVITSARTRRAVTGLLDGSRRSTDAEGEAYALLLTEYCRFWNKSMPYMFEREGDYTELLVPSGLLTDGATITRAREVLPEEVCKDVEVIGWLYQFYISERKQEVFDSFSAKGSARKLAGPEEIPAVTQLFTPHWIVRYLVENSVGQLWMLNRPTSRLVDQMDYYIAPGDKEIDFLKINGPEELTVIDPACGSGHMLTYAFDLLYLIYEEEGYAPSEIPGLILRHNLHGTEVDPRAGALAAFALTMKARAKNRRFFSREVEPQVRVIEPISFGPDELDFFITKSGESRAEESFWNQFQHADTLGSLIQPNADETIAAEPVLSKLNDDLIQGRTRERARKVVAQAQALCREYAVVTANPPYMGSKNMDVNLAEFAKSYFPDSKSDLFAMFIERCLAFTAQGGLTAMITMQSWMFLSSYDKLRASLLNQRQIKSMLHLGTRAFDSIGGEVVSATAFVLSTPLARLRVTITADKGAFVRLVDGASEAEKVVALRAAIDGRNKASGYYIASSEDFAAVPGSPIVYWLSEKIIASFGTGRVLGMEAEPRRGLDTGNNERFVRSWWEVSSHRRSMTSVDRSFAKGSEARWFPFNKGGEYRKWWGNQELVVNWESDGSEIRDIKKVPGARPQNLRFYFLPTVSWSRIAGTQPSFRSYPAGSIFSSNGPGLYADDGDTCRPQDIGVLNSSTAVQILEAIAPTMDFQAGQVAQIPLADVYGHSLDDIVELLTSTSKHDWEDFETAWDFGAPSFPQSLPGGSLRSRLAKWSERQYEIAGEQQARESESNRIVAEAFGVQDEVPIDVPLHRVSLSRNVEFRYGPGKTVAENRALEYADIIAELISYAVGCMFGRYSLDEQGLILADQGSTLQDYFAKVPEPTFTPDADNVIPFVDDGWFEDDIVERFRQFLRTAFGADHFEENLRFVEESLGVKTIRDYFISRSNPSSRRIAKSKFYVDHVKRYTSGNSRRPIYWMFSSPKGSFNALIYMHRYTPATVSTVLNEYLREYRAKLEIALQRAEEASAGGASAKAQNEADRLRVVLAELRDYEHDVLYPLDIQKLEMDLDDGVLVNYLRLGRALRDCGLEKDRQKVKTWSWPTNRLEASE